MRRLVTATIWLVLSTLLPAQTVEPTGKEDLRDRIELTNGKTVTGRLINPFDKEEFVLLQGGKRVRVKRSEAKRVVTIHDHLRELLRLHAAAPDQPAQLWMLAEYAKAKQLDNMAQLFAYRVLTLDPEHKAAHELLGHRLSGKHWLWRRNDKWMKQAEFEQFTADWGHPLELTAEHWAIRTNADVKRAVDALLDLERLYLFVFEKWGEKWDLYEVLLPMQTFVWKDKEAMPSWTMLRLPYYSPNIQDRGCYSFFDGPAPRPTNLFRVGTEAMLNMCLAVNFNPVSVEHRLVDWFEIGFGQWVESQLDGLAGRVKAQPPSMDPQRVALVLNTRRYPLTLIFARNVDDNYYDSVTDYKDMDWAYAQAFVAFLMANVADDHTADHLLEYAYLAMRKQRGDSSNIFDKVYAKPVEKFEKPFEAWLRKHSLPPIK